MDKYKIILIANKYGSPRVDGRYPLRIGRICKKPEPILDCPMCIEYLQNADGSDYSGRFLRTSTVQCVSEHGNIIQIETRNSVYRFMKVED